MTKGKYTLSKRKGFGASQAASVIQAAWRKRPRRSGVLDSVRTALSTVLRSPPAVATMTGIGSLTHVTPDGAGGSFSDFKLVKARVGPPASIDIADQEVVRNNAARLTSGIGKQYGGVLATYFDKNDLEAMFTNQLSASFNKTFKIMVKHVVAETLITNQRNSNARFTLYDVQAKIDGNSTVTDPFTAWTSGIDDNEQGTATDYAIPGASPYSSERFNEAFKVLKKTDVVLSPGATHCHRVYYAPNHLVSANVNYKSNAVGGLTTYVFIIFHGSPMNDSTTVTDVSLGPAALDYVTKERLVYSCWLYGSKYSTMTQTIPTSFGVSGRVMGDDGDVEADTAA